ncbi:Ig-like domain-containing protein [Mycobacteriaceae bacterium NPDC060252]
MRREVDSLFHSKAPTIAYDSSATTQLNGAISGQIRAVDANSDTIKLTVVRGPSSGSVTVNQDGSFTYIPNPATLVAGGADSFTVRASDLGGDPLHLNWLVPARHATNAVVEINTVAQVSPLVTAAEVSTEQRALAIVNSGALDASMGALKAKWLATQQQTFADAGGVDAQNMAQLDGAVKEYAMNAAMTAVNIADDAAGRPSFFWVAAPAHTINGVRSPGNQVYYDNPDTLYRSAYISAGASYSIAGKINGEIPADVNISTLTGSSGQSSATLTGKDLHVNSDGAFTIIAGRDASLAGTPNYLYLSPDTQQIFVRNTITDWNASQALSLSIQQTSGTNSMMQAAQITGVANGILQQAVNVTTDAWFPLARKAPVNTLPEPANAGSQTLSTQEQSIGHFNLADNQALVVTLAPGSAKYFTVPVTNVWTVSPDYSTGVPTSRNNAQAIANPDGSYTLVISKTDSGVANWVSTGGLNQGTIYARWQGLDANATVQPTATAQVVTLDQLKSVLPSTTVYFTKQQRAQEIAERQSGYTLRTAPYLSVGSTPTQSV